MRSDYSQKDLARFYAKVAAPNADGCMLWLGATKPNGYGEFWFNRKHWYAHRFAFVAAGGVLVEGMTIDHVRARGCRSTACVNPAHLEQVTSRENVMRGDTLPARCIAKTHCPQGHAYDSKNTYVERTGERHCRTCDRLRKRAAYHANAELQRARMHDAEEG